jgi:hypothetical protein
MLVKSIQVVKYQCINAEFQQFNLQPVLTSFKEWPVVYTLDNLKNVHA